MLVVLYYPIHSKEIPAFIALPLDLCEENIILVVTAIEPWEWSLNLDLLLIDMQTAPYNLFSFHFRLIHFTNYFHSAPIICFPFASL